MPTDTGRLSPSPLFRADASLSSLPGLSYLTLTWFPSICPLLVVTRTNPTATWRPAGESWCVCLSRRRSLVSYAPREEAEGRGSGRRVIDPIRWDLCRPLQGTLSEHRVGDHRVMGSIPRGRTDARNLNNSDSVPFCGLSLIFSVIPPRLICTDGSLFRSPIGHQGTASRHIWVVMATYQEHVWTCWLLFNDLT